MSIKSLPLPKVLQELLGIEISCPRCQKSFRLRPADGRSLPDEVPCPGCDAAIAVPEAPHKAQTPDSQKQASRSGEESGWVKTEISTIFEHPDAPRRRPEDPPRLSPKEADSDLSTRVFRNVTDVDRPSLAATGAPRDTETNRPPQPSTAQATDSNTAESSSLLERLRSKSLGEVHGAESVPPNAPRRGDDAAVEQALTDSLLSIADEAATAIDAGSEQTTQPLSSPPAEAMLAASAPPEPPPGQPPGDRPATSLSQRQPTSSDALPSPPETDADQPTPGAIADELSKSVDLAGPSKRWADSGPHGGSGPLGAAKQDLTEADLTGPWPIRVDDVAYEPVDESALADLLKSGVWLAVIELKTRSGHWLPLDQHPAYSSVRTHLLDQTRHVVERISTGEWDRDPPRPAEPTPRSDTDVQPQPDGSPRPAEPAAHPRWVYPTVAVLGGVLLALAMLLIVIPKIIRPTGSEVDGTAGKQPHPALTTPALTEATNDQWQIAVQTARRTIRRAASPDTFAAGLIGHHRPKLARTVAVDAMIDRGVTPHLASTFNEAIAADSALHPTVITFGPDRGHPGNPGVDQPVDAIHALGGGRSISLRVTRDGKNVFAFKPAQDEWNNGWRAEVASYLFCEIVPCHFDVPRNRAARISRRNFNTLYGNVGGDWQAAYAERFDKLHWIEEQGPDGKLRPYLYGTLKDWVPHFIDWPIEYTQVWEHWLDVRFHPANLTQPYAEAMAPFKDLAGGAFYQDILSEQGAATLRDVARQLSSILVFDYLTQNWDRFSESEEYFGVNNQFADGTFISLDNGAAFYTSAVETVGPRFDKTSRFSRSMITAVRALDPAVVNAVLFPSATWIDRKRLKLFWKQRTKLLKRVGHLTDTYGQQRVFEFR